jgi:hypothetical protein
MKSGTMSRNVLSAPGASASEAPAEKAAGAAKSAAPRTAAEQEMEFRKRQQDQAKAGKKSEQKSAEGQAKEQNCRNARERLAQYDIGGRISRINAQGERYYMEDAQIEQEKARARTDVAQFCN